MHSSLYKSLRSKIFARFTLLVGIALVATGGLSVFIARSTIEQRTHADLLILTHRQADRMMALIDSHKSLTRVLAKDSVFVNNVYNPRLRRHMIDIRDTHEAIENIIVTSSQGEIIASTDSQLEGQSAAQLPHFQEGSQRAYIGPLHLAQGSRTYVIATPVRSNSGNLNGVLLAEFRLAPLYAVLSQAKTLGRTGKYLLLEPKIHGGFCTNPHESIFSARGTLATMLEQSHKSVDGVFKPAQGQPSLLCSLAAGGKEGIIIAEDERGQTTLAAHHAIHNLGLGLIVKVDSKEVYQPVELLVTVLVGTTCILLLLVIFIALRLSHDVVHPILSLRKSLQQLNTGHWEHKRSVFTNDELEVLDKEVSRLAIRLKDAYSSLEERVEERTQELDEQHAKDEALLESIGEGVLAINMNGKILTGNASAVKMLHWEKEQIVDSHFGSILNLRKKDGKLVDPQQHIVERAIREKATIRTSPIDTLFCERKDGSRFPISMTAVPFLIGMEMKGVVITFRDITEEKRIDRMKSEFISLASHQLRTPLTAVGWYIELLNNEGVTLNEEQKGYVSQIMESHRRMVDLVNSLLNVSRIELGKVKIEPVEITVKNLVERTVSELEPEIQKKNITLSQKLPEDMSVTVDPDLVHIVLENLLSNSVKYTPNQGTMEITVIADDHELHVSVCDNGMGIPKTQQERIFEKLFRADNVVKTDTVGTGIGLYIAKETVQAWGGSLWFESEEGKGTTFTFTMPTKMKKVNPEE